MDLSGTLYIKSLFDKPNNRTVDVLSELYKPPRIREILQDLIRESRCDFGIYTGKKILIKPNWVSHHSSPQSEFCMTTHPNFVLAILEEVLEHAPGEVIIADAPVQGCSWEKLISPGFTKSVGDLSARYQVPVRILDLRRTTWSLQKTSTIVKNEIRDLSKYVMFDLGSKSYLEPISSGKPNFRVTNYNPDRLAISHSRGKHVYCIAREVFEADYIIALPKPKTHQKTGITNAVKLLVGINGDKDFLPHHRAGGTACGGDCYPGGNILMRAAEFILDQANRSIGKTLYKPYIKISKILWRLARKTKEHQLSAGWHGNDTTWRMAMDLNTIARYGSLDGKVQEQEQRSILYICDGVIGGQGNGPLHPDPLPLGVVMLSENAALMDYVLTLLMGFIPEKIPLIRESYKTVKPGYKIVLDGEEVPEKELSLSAIDTTPPDGWLTHLKGAAL